MKSELKIDAFKKKREWVLVCLRQGTKGDEAGGFQVSSSELPKDEGGRAQEHTASGRLTHRPPWHFQASLTDPRGPWVERVDGLAPGAAGKRGATAPEESWLFKQTNFMAFGGQLSSFEYRIYIKTIFFDMVVELRLCSTLLWFMSLFLGDTHWRIQKWSIVMSTTFTWHK